MGTTDEFVARSQERLRSLAGAARSVAPAGWNADELEALRDLGGEILPRASADLRAQPIRTYLEIGAGARKALLVAAAIWPELAAIGRKDGLAPALFVTEPAVRRLYEPYVDGADAIRDWTQSANLLGGMGARHGSMFYLGDIDTEQPGPLAGTRQWVAVARAIDRLVTNRLANFVLIHQLGKQALDPTAA